MASRSDTKQPSHGEKCRLCNGCIRCEEVYCIFNAQGNPQECRREQCLYCIRFLQKQRLFLNNVG